MTRRKRESLTDRLCDLLAHFVGETHVSEGAVDTLKRLLAELQQRRAHTFIEPIPIPMLLWCPGCGERHLDVGEWSTRVHHTHACQSCGMVWRPAIQPTVGVQHLPGFKNAT